MTDGPSTPSASPTTLVTARGVSKGFLGVQALDAVDFEILRGEIHALVGENGAGKSTLVKILSGLYEPDSGVIAVGGESIQFRHRSDAERFGIATIHQELSLVPDLDVASNMFLARPPLFRDWRGRLGIIDRTELHRQAVEALSLVHASGIDSRRRARSLGVSAAQLVLISRGLSRDMKVFILDEPTAALTQLERDELFRRLHSLRAHGVGILFVSHRLDEVMAISDRITVMRDGRAVATIETAKARLEEIIELMLDRPLHEMYPRRPSVNLGPLVLEVKGLTRKGLVNNIDLQVRAGEVVGVTGQVGAGKTELARAIVGADPIDSGEISIDGQPIRPRSPSDGIDRGIALVPEDRRTQGLVLLLSVSNNLAIGVANCRRVARTLVPWLQAISSVRKAALARSYIERFQIRTRGHSQPVGELSGGNQQKVVLSKNLATKPLLMILDEPTRGIDVGSKSEIYRMISQLATEGVGVLFLSSEVQEVVRMCDRIYVLRQGTIAAELAGSEATEKAVILHSAAEVSS